MKDAPPYPSTPFCPSAQHDWDGSVAIGVMGGTATEPRMTHLAEPLPVGEQLLALSAPVTPTEVFRFAAPCMQGACVHFRNEQCGLVTQIVQLLPRVAETVPRCAIRPHCRWWRQEGRDACLRCSQVVTDNFYPSSEMVAAATPVGIRSA